MADMGCRLSCVVAMAKNHGIGKNNDLPWRLRTEMKHFTKVTKTTVDKDKQNAVVMGRKTWESIPEKHRPLNGRLNIILSKTMSSGPEDCLLFTSLQDALKTLKQPPYISTIEQIFVIGGSSLYEEVFSSPWLHRIYLTRVHLDVECDVFLPQFEESHFNIISIPGIPTEIQEENGTKFQYFVYEKK